MRYDPKDTAEKHERILDAAGALFRSKGLSVNVRDIMSAAGLTHGAFYAHFESKDALIAESAARCLDEVSAFIASTRDQADPLAALAGFYLDKSHRDNPAAGCAVAALGGELSRQTAESRDILTGKIEHLIEQIAVLTGTEDAEVARIEAIRIYAMSVGALIMARLVSRPELSDEILAAARPRHDPPPASAHPTKA